MAAIIDHCDRICGFLSHIQKSKAVYDADILLRDAIKMNLLQIGELSRHLSEELKKKEKDIPWHNIYAMRNVIAHGYLEVDEDLVWETCLKDIPDLKMKLEGIVENDEENPAGH